MVVNPYIQKDIAPNKFERIFRESKIILTEGALVERLKTEFNLEMDAFLNHAMLIYDNPEALELLYKQYIDNKN